MGLKFVFKHGGLSCNNELGMRRWGCFDEKRLALVVSDADGYVIMPDAASESNEYYVRPGFHANSEELVLLDFATPMYAYRNQDVKLSWLPNKEDHVGATCADVHALFD